MRPDKQIQIPESLWYRIMMIAEDPSRFGTEDNWAIVKDGIRAKLKRQIEHDLYSVYKSAKSDAERERARKAYLDSKGIPESFRW